CYLVLFAVLRGFPLRLRLLVGLDPLLGAFALFLALLVELGVVERHVLGAHRQPGPRDLGWPVRRRGVLGPEPADGEAEQDDEPAAQDPDACPSTGHGWLL